MIFYIIWISGLLTVIALIFAISYIAIYEKKWIQLLVILFISFCLILVLSFENYFIYSWYFLNILYSLIFFYILLYCLGSLKFAKPKDLVKDYQFSITIIVVIYNEEEVITETVNRLLELKYPNSSLEIIIVDDNSTDNSLFNLSTYEDKIRIIKRNGLNGKGKPSAINETIPQIKSDLIGIFDADSLPEADFLIKSVPYFTNNKVAIVQGKNVQYNEENTIVSKLTSLDIDSIYSTILKGKNSLNGMGIFEGRGAVLRRSTFLELNGFDINLPTEDWDYGFRCQINGYSVIYDGEIYNYEQSVETVKEFYYQRFRWLSSTILTFFKNFNAVIKSSKLTSFQKLDFCFPFSLTLWSLLLNVQGILSLLIYINGYELYPYYYILLFLIMQIIHLTPALLLRKRIKDFLFIPLMYIYSWSFSVIISFFLGVYYIKKSSVVFRKAQHYKLDVKKN